MKAHALNFRTLAIAAAVACFIGWVVGEARAEGRALNAPLSVVDSSPAVLRGKATYYSSRYIGRTMANGRIYRGNSYSCACWWFPLGSLLEIRAGQRSVFVINTDRGPAWWAVQQNGAVIDLPPIVYQNLFQGIALDRSVEVRRVR